MCSNYPNRNILDWLELILFERFGILVRLEGDAEKIYLSLHDDGGSKKKIVIPVFIGFYKFGHVQFHTATWQSVLDGWQSVLGKPLPAPTVSPKLPSPLIERRDADIFIHYDILGLTYWMLARLEEVGRKDLDIHARFPASSSHGFQYGYLERPIVDEWLHILGQVIHCQWPGVSITKHQFKLKVSHDVDQPSRYGFASSKHLLRRMAGDLLRRHDYRGFFVAPWIWGQSDQMLHPSDPANTFDWIMDVSERHGLISAFYFICGRTDVDKDADYELEHPAIRELMRRIHKRGHEIGLHPSYNSYQSPAQIGLEANRLKTVCMQEGIMQSEWGGRQHYLRYEHPQTLRGWAEVGLNYDSTLSYADWPGFRCGTCYEYPAFDPVAQEVLNLRIRPLIAMECTVMDDHYMGLGSTEAALAKFCQLKAACEAVNGCFTLLWHNCQFDTSIKRRIYENVLRA